MTLSNFSSSSSSTLVALLRMRARTEPERLAYSFLADGEAVGQSLTHAVLDARARAIAVRLQREAALGDRVLLLYPPGLEFLAGFFGCLYAGVIAVPSYPPKRNRPDPRLQAIVADAGARIVLTAATVLDELEPRLTHSPELRALDWIATDRILADERETWREPVLGPADLAFLQYTSGSTSVPKGVMVSHGNLLHNLDDLDRGWEHTRDSVMVTWLPIFHDMGLIYGALLPLFKGFLCVMLPPPAFLQRPARWLEAISRHRGTHSAAPNFAYDLCVASTTVEQRAALDLRSWHFSLNAAEPVRAETLTAFNAAFAPCGLSPLTVSPGYGLAEATLKVSALPRAEPTRIAHVRSEDLARHRVVVGEVGAPGVQPVVGCGWGQVDNRTLIVDPETSVPCAPDVVGEIWFAGPSVAQGYWQRPEETAATFHARLAGGEGPFMRTGDLGFIRAGEVFVTGRVKDLIIVRGLNHYPQDIELTVEKCHPALRPSGGAAFAVELHGREALVVTQEVERTHLRRIDVDAVTAAIRQAVAEQHELPVDAIVLLRPGTLPKTSSGKIMRRACRQRFLDGTLERVGEWRRPDSAGVPLAVADPAPRLALEVAVIETWLAVRVAQRLDLPRERIDPREPFSRYGLDSVAAIELSGALEHWMGRRLSPTLVYDYPSIRALSEYLAVAAATAPEAAETPRVAAVATADAPVAIIGLGCRFPGADSPDAFWQLLVEGGDAITRVTRDRWDAAAIDGPPWGGFLPSVDGFDAEFFSISPREADLMDPQQRLLLEVAHEALEDAGLVPAALAGSRAGVFIGISNNDYGRLLARHPAGTEAHAGTGNALSIAANRVSYVFDLRGPSLVIDTACSAALVAVHHAVRSLQSGESSLAIAGGANLMLAPELTATYARAGMLAPDGHCKTFDAAADGYVRGEGCGVVILKLLSAAQRDGDRVAAVICGSAINQDGRSNGLTAPNGPAQQAVVRAALRDARVAAAAISYVETHGTGTALGDPIEVNALREVLLEGRSAGQPCWLGSVKTNIGHLEAASGIAGLIKVVLALRHRVLPQHLHLRTLNPLIQLAGTPLAIPATRTPWPAPAHGRRLAGVSSFGVGGTNAHVVVSEPPEAPAREAISRPGNVLVLSARSPAALRALADRYATFLPAVDPGAWPDVCHTAAAHRTAYRHRLALGARTAADAVQPLAAFARDGAAAGVWRGEAVEPPRIAFLFSGQGSLYAGVGRELYTSQPGFRAAFDECRELIRAQAGWDVIEALGSAEKLARTEFAQVALFVFEYALARTWQAWGAEPAAVIGHSVGEYAAAVIAGALALEDALPLLIARARLMGALGETGAMLAVPADASAVADVIARHQIEVAAFNSPRQVVLTGARDAIAAAAAELRQAGVPAQELGVRQGYHSREMEPMLADFTATAAAAKLGAPARIFVSTVTGRIATDELAQPDYWVKQIRQPVRFAEAIRALHGTGATVLIEVGPRGILAALGQQSWPDPSGDWLVSLQPGRGEWAQLLEAAGRAFVRAVPIRWAEIDRGFTFRRVGLPLSPFDRQRHWFSDTAARTTGDDGQGRPGSGAIPASDDEVAHLLADEAALTPEDRAAAPRIFAALRRARERHSLRDCTTGVCWPVQPLMGTVRSEPGHWLLVGPSEPVLIAAVAARGQTVVAADELVAGDYRGVIFLAGNGSAEAEIARLVRVAQAASAAPLWIITRGAIPLTPAEARSLALDHAPLWGMGRVFALEQPGRWGGLIDLPVAPGAADFSAAVDEMLAAAAGEGQVALRGTVRHVARLEPVPLTDRVAPILRADATYWITGGTGALGLHVARWLAAKGARHLLLTARRAPSTAAAEAIEALRTVGVAVRVVAADVAEPADVQRVLGLAVADGAPVRGIVHAAGVLSLEPLTTLAPATLMETLRPKVAGARALHAATRTLELDFFILFSSFASIWGSKGQGHYAAANHALDALAHHRRALGLPALSINWGPWADGGMAGEREQTELARRGVSAMSPATSLQVLDWLMTGDRAQVAVARIDWRVFKQLFELRGPRHFFAAFASAEVAVTSTECWPEVAALADTPVAERMDRLSAFLQAQVALALGFKDGRQPDPRRGFFELGMDSMIAIELRNRLGRAFARNLPSTLVFDHANIRLLADYLARTALDWAEPAAPLPATTVAEAATDLEAALAERLARLESLVRER
jgi:acyl transferase domain-containing protein/acyl-CoA synthetase (AMP-forming)/AMP-acid ligase II/acyl carrier protein